MSFSTCSCVLWQKEQRNGSSGVNRFTIDGPSRRNHTHDESEPIVKRKTHVLPAHIAFTTNHLERHAIGSKRPDSIHPFHSGSSRSTHHTGTELAMLGDNFVHDAVSLGLVGGHDEI